MRKLNISLELVRDVDNTYYADIKINGEPVLGLPQNVSYPELSKAICEKTGLELPETLVEPVIK